MAAASDPTAERGASAPSSASALLRQALAEGPLRPGENLDRVRALGGYRSYLPDGSGWSWQVPAELCGGVTFALDVERPGPVRPSLRRYGVHDEVEFARAWTRAEVFAKLFDVPIITWLSQHGLSVPEKVAAARVDDLVAWQTWQLDAVVVASVGVRLPGRPGCHRSGLGS